LLLLLFLDCIELGGSLLDGVGHLEVKLKSRHHTEVLVGVAVVFNHREERIVRGQVKPLFDFSICNAKHYVLLDIDKDLDLSQRVFLDTDFTPHNNPLFFLSSFLCCLRAISFGNISPWLGADEADS
jgi:hypothetical protein